ICPALSPRVSGRCSAGPSEPTTVTSRPSSSQLTPSAMTTRQCQADHGRRSRRAGMSEPGVGIVYCDRMQEKKIRLATGELTYFHAGGGKPLLYLHPAGGVRRSKVLARLGQSESAFVPV